MTITLTTDEFAVLIPHSMWHMHRFIVSITIIYVYEKIELIAWHFYTKYNINNENKMKKWF